MAVFDDDQSRVNRTEAAALRVFVTDAVVVIGSSTSEPTMVLQQSLRIEGIPQVWWAYLFMLSIFGGIRLIYSCSFELSDLYIFTCLCGDRLYSMLLDIWSGYFRPFR